MSETKSLTKKNIKNINSRANLPNLQNSMMVSKTMLTISKVDLDSRMIYKQQIQHKSNSRQQNRSYSSMVKKNQSKSKLIQTTSKFFDKKMRDEKIISGTDSLNQMKTQLPKNIRVQKSKISTKSHGIVQAYAANSHPGPYNSINEDRVCIATNLTKTSIKTNQISFFAIYDGNNGSMLADFMRDKFHHLLTEEQSFTKDMEVAIKNTIRKLQNYFDNDPSYSKNISDVSFIMFILVGKFGYCVQMGDPKLIISKNLGEQCLKIIDKTIEGRSKYRNLSFRKIQFDNSNLNKMSIPNLHFQSQFRQGKIVNIKQIQIDQSIDFILMGQGLFESIRDVDLMRKTWKSLVSNQSQDNIHIRIGQAANSLYTQVFKTTSTKNVSLIIIGFQSLVQLIKKDQKMQLPFIDQNKE